ncbi:MAG: mechanosensitive ion channel [Chitinophagales bacterium]|nr:mechanosensitive ion channel [Chitinophagales bacterium]
MDTTSLAVDFNGLSHSLLTKGSEILMEYGLKIAGAILIYIIGTWIIKNISKGLNKLFAGKKYDPSLQTFLRSLVSIGLNVLLIIVIIGQLGVNTTSFAGLLAGAAVAIGAALNGTLGNLAGGVMLLIFKPFKVGEMIEAQGAIGVVKELSIFNTIILSPENKTIILPNGPLSTGTITNYNTHGNLRVDLVMAIALDQNIDKARQIAIDAMLSHPKVLKSPVPEVALLKVADGMTTLAIRPYTTQAAYWDVYFGAQELVKNAWDSQGISGPIPHRVIIQK